MFIKIANFHVDVVFAGLFPTPGGDGIQYFDTPQMRCAFGMVASVHAHTHPCGTATLCSVRSACQSIDWVELGVVS